MSSSSTRKVPNGKSRSGNSALANNNTFTHPPQIQPQVSHNQRFRFTCTSLANKLAITWLNILDLMLVSATATVGYDLFDQARLNFIEVWANNVIGSAPASLTVQFPTLVLGQIGDGKVHSDTSVGILPAHIKCAPSKNSQASQWQVSSANTAFLLSCPVGTVIDVDISFKTNSNTPVASANALVGGSAGEVYYRALDGLAVAGTQLPTVFPNAI